MKKKFFKNWKWVLIPCFLLLLGIFFSPRYTSFLVQRKEFKKDFRPEYCKLIDGTKSCVSSKIFQFLPDYPKDFIQIYYLIYYGKIKNLSAIGEEYWKQPEILPTWETSGINAYLTLPEPGRFGAFGFGFYPSEAFVTLKPGEAVKLTTWLHTAWGVQTLQGMSLKSVYPSHAESPGKIAIKQEPSQVEKYFNVSITPSFVLLGPTWPYFEQGPGFDHNGWIVPITLEIKALPQTPKGDYSVGISPFSPPEGKNEEWFLKFKLRYTPIEWHHIGKPFFTVFLKVE